MTEQRIYCKWMFRSHRTFFSTFRKYGKNEDTNQNSNLHMHTKFNKVQEISQFEVAGHFLSNMIYRNSGENLVLKSHMY